MKYSIVYVVMLVVSFSAMPLCAENNPGRELEKIKNRMKQAASSLDEQKTAEQGLLHDLTIVSTTIKQSNARIKSIRAETKAISQQLKSVRQDLKKSNQQMDELKRKLNRRLVALYKEGETGPLKLFFSSASPMELAQQYHYLSRVLDHDRELLDSFRLGIERQANIQRQLEKLQADQDALLVEAERKREEAGQARELYNQILKQVKKDQQQLKAELKRLESRARRLEQLVQELKPAQQPVSGKVSFASLRGRLPWPVKGRISIGFGTQHNEAFGSVLESHGIEIAYSRAQTVKAVSHGRIVFASWFKGYGNLIIIAHDDGYHTLYAQVGSLEGSIGDTVLQGEVIGRTGNPEESGIYFEIRHDGSPIDPTLWLGAN